MLDLTPIPIPEIKFTSTLTPLATTNHHSCSSTSDSSDSSQGSFYPAAQNHSPRAGGASYSLLPMVRKVDRWTSTTVRGYLEGMRELADDNLSVWLQADVCCVFSTFVETCYLIVNGDSLPRTQRTTRMCTSSRSIGSRALWQARLYCHLRSNIYLVCSSATTDG
jgi:hypothetical protein